MIKIFWFPNHVFLQTGPIDYVLEETRFKTNYNDTYAARILTWAAELMFHKHDEDYCF